MAKPKYQTYLNIPMENFNKMDKDEMSYILKKLAPVANKRYAEFERRGERSPAYRYVERSGGRFSAKAKTLNQQRQEFIRIKGFLESETGTVKGWSKVKAKTVKSLGKMGINVTSQQFDDLWESYEKLKELDRTVASHGMKYSVLKDISNQLKDTTKSPEEIAVGMKNRINEIYEEQEKLKSR